jgi:outer membrane protein TolC
MKKRIATGCLVLMLAPGVVAAQSAPSPMGERLSLDTALRLALANNRQLQSARLQVLKADEDIEVARSRRLPVFDIEVHWQLCE